MKRFLCWAGVTAMSCIFVCADKVVIPHVVSGIDSAQQFSFVSEIHILNLSDIESAIGTVTVFLDSGAEAPVFPTGMPVVPAVGRKTFTIPSRGQTTVEIPARGGVTLFWVQVESSSPVGVVVGLQARSVESDATATSVIPGPSAQRFTAHAFISERTNTGLAICNPSPDETAEILLQLRDGSGATTQEATITLGPHQKITQFLNEDGLFTGISQLSGSLEVTSSTPIAVLVVRVDDAFWSTFPAFPR